MQRIRRLPAIRNALSQKGRQRTLYTFAQEAKVDADTAGRIADYLDQRLQSMKAGDRIRADLTVTDEPKKRVVITPNTQIGSIDAVEVYSATYEWLLEIRNVSRSSGGLEVV